LLPKRDCWSLHGSVAEPRPAEYRLDVVTSALQKSMFRAIEVSLADYGNSAFKALRVIASEDVGLAWPEGAAIIHAPHENWLEIRKAEKGRPPEESNAMLFLVHAVVARARGAFLMMRATCSTAATVP
jgi:hypothetical protein